MLIRFLDKLGSVGAMLAAAACPICFPLLAAAGSVVGFGALHPYEGKFLYLYQLFILVALVGLVLSFRRHRKAAPLVTGILSAVLIFYAFHIRFNEMLNYLGLVGLLGASALNYLENRRCTRCKMGETMKLTSTITCPVCGFQKEENMPTDACQFFYECTQCKTVLRPKPGECCVFCSYGTEKCPSIQ
ncbi:MAG: MerC family mercury resistance protein [Geobacter sp.]|nr:MerC family mercury resistance protein [Geobacter sp.]